MKTSARQTKRPAKAIRPPSKSAKRKNEQDREPIEQPRVKKRKTKKDETKHTEHAHHDINNAPTTPLAVLLFGDGENGELGLGPKRDGSLFPRLNPFLDPAEASKYHIVQVACGGMHSVALTADNKIVTWGVNDDGALGRDTNWTGGLCDVDADSDDEDGELNPFESTPAEIPPEHFPADVRFAQVAAGDSCSFTVTTTGLVYGWGTFRNSQGDQRFGYNSDATPIKTQLKPKLINGINNITQIVCGSNHVLALDVSGNIWGWGCNDDNQLGRRLFGRFQDSFIPRQIRVCLGRATYIASGEYHSFALDKSGDVWAWGRNSNCEAGCSVDSSLSALPYPMKIESLCGQQVKQLAGGVNHSCAVTTDGRCFAWGRLESGQLGIRFTTAQLKNQALIRNDIRDKPYVCMQPTLVSDIGNITHVGCGTDHTIFINQDGHAYATGFNSQGQLGLGSTDDVGIAERITRRSVADRKLSWAEAGGRFSIVYEKTA